MDLSSFGGLKAHSITFSANSTMGTGEAKSGQLRRRGRRQGSRRSADQSVRIAESRATTARAAG